MEDFEGQDKVFVLYLRVYWLYRTGIPQTSYGPIVSQHHGQEHRLRLNAPQGHGIGPWS